jgi:hypothetical protein
VCVLLPHRAMHCVAMRNPNVAAARASTLARWVALVIARQATHAAAAGAAVP